MMKFEKQRSKDSIIQSVLSDCIYASASWCINIRPSISYSILLGDTVEDKWFDCLKNHHEKLIIMENAESDYDQHLISYEDLSNAIDHVLKNFPFEQDGIFADNVLQVACFKEIVYG